MRNDDGLQLDFMTTIHGVRSFEALRAQSGAMNFGDTPLMVASLAAVLASKRAAGRPRDKAVLDTLERAVHENEKTSDKKTATRRTQGRK
jgi:hypothetical protein